MRFVCHAPGVDIGGQFYPSVNGVVELPEGPARLARLSGMLPAPVHQPPPEIVTASAPLAAPPQTRRRH